MTKTEWRDNRHLGIKLEYLRRGKVSDRKYWLFACACLRRVWPLINDEQYCRAVEAAEDFAGGKDSDLNDFRGSGLWADLESYPNADYAAELAAADACDAASRYTMETGASEYAGYDAECARQNEFLRDIFGDPFGPRPVIAAAWLDWNNGLVGRLARSIYDERHFEDLPALADALIQAGCDNPEILEHCISGGTHVRGCWVIEFILGKDRGMTEAEWLACSDPAQMWHYRGKSSVRQERLFAVECCRRIGHLYADERCRHALNISERFADGHATLNEWKAAREAVAQIAFDANGAEVVDAAARAAWSAGCDYVTDDSAKFAAIALTRPDERAAQASLLRDIYGNPFRPVTIDAALLTFNDGAITKLAQTVYDERAFDQMPALAQALVEAGCTSEDILTHCRSGGEHVRGCWVIDLLLGKE